MNDDVSQTAEPIPNNTIVYCYGPDKIQTGIVESNELVKGLDEQYVYTVKISPNNSYHTDKYVYHESDIFTDRETLLRERGHGINPLNDAICLQYNELWESKQPLDSLYDYSDPRCNNLWDIRQQYVVWNREQIEEVCKPRLGVKAYYIPSLRSIENIFTPYHIQWDAKVQRVVTTTPKEFFTLFETNVWLIKSIITYYDGNKIARVVEGFPTALRFNEELQRKGKELFESIKDTKTISTDTIKEILYDFCDKYKDVYIPCVPVCNDVSIASILHRFEKEDVIIRNLVNAFEKGLESQSVTTI